MDTKRTTLIENIQTLKGFAEYLVVAPSLGWHRKGWAKAYRAYRAFERRFVKKYVGKTADAEEVWAAIVAGEAFPSFPCLLLPGNEYGWWNIENPTTRAWWVKETLLEAGWERDGDQWFPPEEETEEETEDD